MKTTNRQKPMGADITPAGLAKTAGHAEANTPENLGMHTPPAAGKAAHTPTPWRVGTRDGYNACNIYAYTATGHGDQDKHFDEAICSVFSIPLHTSVAELMTLPKYKEGLANAAFIVTACNSHAALVEALEKSQLAFMNVARLARFESKASMEAVAQLRHCEERNVAALALAKGGAQ